jgi:hypothetical protein
LATVITNLLSAIPWLGKSLVEFVWGGLFIFEPYIILIIDNVLIILFYVGKPYNLIYISDLFPLINLFNVNGIIINLCRQAAGMRSIFTSNIPQRLNAKDSIYACIVGIF